MKQAVNAYFKVLSYQSCLEKLWETMTDFSHDSLCRGPTEYEDVMLNSSLSWLSQCIPHQDVQCESYQKTDRQKHGMMSDRCKLISQVPTYTKNVHIYEYPINLTSHKNNEEKYKDNMHI